MSRIFSRPEGGSGLTVARDATRHLEPSVPSIWRRWEKGLGIYGQIGARDRGRAGGLFMLQRRCLGCGNAQGGDDRCLIGVVTPVWLRRGRPDPR